MMNTIKCVNNIDMLDVLPLIDLCDISEGLNSKDYYLNDGRSVTIEYSFYINGYNYFPFDDPDGNGIFIGGFDLDIRNWIGYDDRGNIIPVINEKLFKNELSEMLYEQIEN